MAGASESQQFGLAQDFSDLQFNLFLGLPQHLFFLTLIFFSLNSNMLFRITIKQVPTSASTAAHNKGWPARARPSIATLVTTEKIMLARTVLCVRLASRMACGILRMSFDMSVMWLVSVATADPEIPMEMPTSAVASAGASFIPSPIIIVGPT